MLPFITIGWLYNNSEDDNKEFDLKFEAYCEVFYPLWVEDSLRTLKSHYLLPFWLPLVSPCNHSVFEEDSRVSKSEAYFEVFYYCR